MNHSQSGMLNMVSTHSVWKFSARNSPGGQEDAMDFVTSLIGSSIATWAMIHDRVTYPTYPNHPGKKRWKSNVTSVKIPWIFREKYGFLGFLWVPMGFLWVPMGAHVQLARRMLFLWWKAAAQTTGRGTGQGCGQGQFFLHPQNDLQLTNNTLW